MINLTTTNRLLSIKCRTTLVGPVKRKFKYFHYLNKYRLWVTANLIHKGYDFVHCICYSFYKSYICKHVLKLADIFGLKIKGYNKIDVFAVNAKRGSKPKKKPNPLEID